jgi:hypothetical protein
MYSALKKIFLAMCLTAMDGLAWIVIIAAILAAVESGLEIAGASGHLPGPILQALHHLGMP